MMPLLTIAKLSAALWSSQLWFQ